jgi:ribosomal subunit interface protein
VDIVITGRHTSVSDRFRQHIADKLTKVSQLAPRARRIDVMLSHEPNRRQSKAGERVEITCHVKGPVVRAEACHEDKYAALDLALEKLMERLRRANDRRQVRRGRRAPESVASATARSWAGPDGAARRRSRRRGCAGTGLDEARSSSACPTPSFYCAMNSSHDFTFPRQ